jgi:carbamoyltransferase
MSAEKSFNKAFPRERINAKIHHVEHHLAHLASTFFMSPFDESAIVSVDGLGDFASAAWGIGNALSLNIEEKVYFPNSLGIFYQSMTQYLGFPNYGDEYKVMGLAAYGKPRYIDQMRKIVNLEKNGRFSINLIFFRFHKEKSSFEWSSGSPFFENLFSEKLETLLGPKREPGTFISQYHKDIASSVQAMYEEAFFHILNHLHQSCRIDNLSLAGGCAMNSVANGKITKKTPFKKVYIQAAAGDAGGAIGAAFYVWHQRLGNKRSFAMDHAFWGPHFSSHEIESLFELRKEANRLQQYKTERLRNKNELCERTASALADGKVVGWFQGRTEWGPRALGNRSILCDPRRSDMRDILNRKIKRRESFRPFAPSILSEKTKEWFETDQDVPFMMQVYQVRKEKSHLIPAVTHVDGSGRLQTVHRETNSRYYHLIECFYRLSGIPIVLNTSFNENEPIVCKPEEAIDCFLRTKMDMLVLEDWIIARNEK